MFTDADLQQIQQRGSLLKTVEQQLVYFRQGFPYLKVVRAATVGDGIIRLNDAEIEDHIAFYESLLPEKDVLKFVPASGAASRMFKDLFAFMHQHEHAPEAVKAEDVPPEVAKFFSRIADFAFYDDLKSLPQLAGKLDGPPAVAHYVDILRGLLTTEGLNYGQLPKGLLKFHRYANGSRTAVEEHLVEGACYGKDGRGRVRLHLTVSPEHKSRFIELLEGLRPQYEKALEAVFELSYSIQKPSTDTLAVDMENRPFRNADGSLLFRPGGHGALLENLNELETEVVFIKNIDNVVPDRIKGETIRYKKALAGVLLRLQEQIFGFLNQLDAGKASLQEVEQFVTQKLCVQLPAAYHNLNETEKIGLLRAKLNRPIRVCGMVKNEGEPGGGPFWAVNPDGSISLQIAETAQIDPNDPQQQAIMQNATHFNPVDLVCGLRDYQGKAFDLMQFRDPQTGFISYKSKDGRELKALELPGLWNGSMSDWNTLFVEVPPITFNPVKKVTDLLRPEHQP
ncbi:MAG: DUF4301 family protein [Bacteroidetes bacterium]|nr:MAG: DUF4301 family protein [Bacteroidota bacterium]